MHELTQVYTKMTELEGDHATLSGSNAKKYLKLVERASKLIETDCDGWGLDTLKKELQELEDDFHEDGKFSAVKANLGVRIQVHMACRQFNLFEHDEGWVFATNKEDKDDYEIHWVVGEETLCNKQVTYTSEPGWSMLLRNSCKICVEKLFRRRVAEAKKEYPDLGEDDGHSSMGEGINIDWDGKRRKWLLMDSGYNFKTDKFEEKIVMEVD